MNPDLFDKIDAIAKKMRKNQNPFGGIQLILSGDFCQLPCVEGNNFCFEASQWNSCVKNIIYLDEIIRQDNVDFQNCLNEIRLSEGNLSDDCIKLLESRVNVSLNNDIGITPTKIFPVNRSVEDINMYEVKKLYEADKNIKTYNMRIISNDEKDAEYYKKHCNAMEQLTLIKGCQVILIYNMDIENKLVNGSRGVVIGFKKDLPIVKFLNGITCVIENYTWEIDKDGEVIAKIIQIPLRLGYAISIHRSQGCTIDYAIIDLKNIFEYGQAYVALSRIKNINGLSIINLNIDKIKAHPKAIEFYKKI